MNGKLLTRVIVFVMVLVSIFAPRSSFAQDDTNLLRNPGWEGGYQLQDGIPELAVPLGWRLYYLETTWPQGKGPAHRPETVVWYIEQAPLDERPIFWVDGIYTLKIFKGGAPVYSGLSQDLDNLQVGARYRFTVPLYADIVEAYTEGRKVPPAGSEQAGVRLGVSKHGASWRDEGQITYSGWFNSANTPNFYLNRLNYVYNFVATDTKMTVWVEMFGADFLVNNGFFLDGLSLVKTGNAPTVTPRPTNTRVPATATATPRPTVAATALPTFAPTDYPTATPYPTNTPLPTNTPRPTATPLPTGPWYTKTPTPTLSPQALITPSETGNEGNGEGAALLDGGNVSSVAFLPPTSTPDAQGVIYSVVGAGDSLWSVAAKNGLTLDQIKELNDLPLGDANVFVSEGQKLIVGRVAAATATPEPEPTAGEEATSTDSAGESADPASTPQPVTPTPTVQIGGSICLRAFEDTNQNGTFDAGEAARTGVAFTILKGDSVISNYVTTGQDLFCIPGLTASTYRVTRSKGNDETLTTGDEATINLEEGAVAEVSFGSVDAQPATPVATTIAEANTATSNTPSSETPASSPARGLLVAVGVAASLLLLAVLVILLSRRSAD